MIKELKPYEKKPLHNKDKKKQLHNKEIWLQHRPQFPALFVVFLILWLVCALLTQSEFCNLTEHQRRPGTGRMVRNPQQAGANAGSFEIEASVVSDPRKQKFSTMSLLKINGEIWSASWPYGTTVQNTPKMGQRVAIKGHSLPLPHDGYGRYLSSEGACGSLRVDALQVIEAPDSLYIRLLKFRKRLIDTVTLNASPANAPLINAVLFGYKSDLSSEKELFKRSGLSHMLAVSGSHFALALAAIFFVLSFVRITRKSKFIIVLFFALLFLGLTGGGVAAQRATLMAVIGQMSFLFKRRINTLSLLGLGGIIILVIAPYRALSLSFALSFAAVAGICMFFRRLNSFMDALPFTLPRFISENISLSLAAQSTTLPLTLFTFKTASLLSFVSMLITSYLFLVLISGGVVYVALMTFFPLAGMWWVRFLNRVTEVLLASVLSLEEIPFLTVSLPRSYGIVAVLWCASVLVFYVWWPRQNISRRRSELRLLKLRDPHVSAIVVGVLGVILVWFGLSNPLVREHVSPVNKIEGIYYLDVGQGDATLIRDGAQNVLIDAGPDPLVLKRALRKVGVAHIDTLIFTHAHADHIEGAKGLTSSLGIKTIIVAQGTASDKNIQRIARGVAAPVEEVLQGDQLETNKFVLKFLWPRKSVSDPEENESCLVTLAKSKNANSSMSSLIMGDAEDSTLKALIEKSNLHTLSTLKLGHHGSKKSLSLESLEKIAPKEVIISVGENTYGHPTPSVLRTLNQKGIPYKRTDQSGTIYRPLMAQ